MAAKIGGTDRKGFRKSVAMLPNKDIVIKSKYRPREWGKIKAVLAHRGLEWADESTVS